MNSSKLRGFLLAAACGVVALQLPSPAAAQPNINEFVADHIGADTNEFVEIFGAPNTDYSAYTIVEIEGDGTSAGLVDDFIQTVGTTDGSGYWVSPFQNNIIENDNITLLLVTGWTGAVGNDIDTNDDGTVDATFWGSIVDSVGVLDPAVAGQAYGQTNLNATFDGISTFAPGGASRIPNGTDTNSISDWRRNTFNYPVNMPLGGEAFNTPGATNSWVPEPGTAMLIMLAAWALPLVGRRAVR
jgi:hypothetical protein